MQWTGKMWTTSSSQAAQPYAEGARGFNGGTCHRVDRYQYAGPEARMERRRVKQNLPLEYRIAERVDDLRAQAEVLPQGAKSASASSAGCDRPTPASISTSGSGRRG
jgi:hypothetical protein